MKFAYKITNKDKKYEEGVRESSDKYALSRQIKKEGGTVISIRETKGRGKITMQRVNEMLARVKLQDKINFTKNLSAMIEAGLPLSRALNILERQTKNIKFKAIIVSIANDIDQGKSFSEALTAFPKVFSSLFVAMVQAGEESGSLAQSLIVIGDQLEKSYKLKKQVKGAMIYPTVVISAMIIIAGVMLVYVVPTLAETFAETEQELPKSTQFIMTVSDLLRNHFFLVLAGVISFFIGLAVARRTVRGKFAIDWFVLHMPIVSKIAKESNAARTTRTLSSLLSSGVDMVQAITITERVMQNVFYKDVLRLATAEVQRGQPLSRIFKERNDIYPLLVGEMIEVGEETGKLSHMLLKVAIFFEDEVDNATKNLSTLIEPLVMIIIGLGVGFFAISMISPMYAVMNNI